MARRAKSRSDPLSDVANERARSNWRHAADSGKSVPLIPPALDDRSYDDLVQEMLASIPAHTPEWVSPQPGDPGRTLIELFAWLADTILYRANLIPERQRIAFLRLLGLPMQPAAAAQGIVALTPNPSSADAMTMVQVPPSPVRRTSKRSASSTSFRSRRKRTLKRR